MSISAQTVDAFKNHNERHMNNLEKIMAIEHGLSNELAQ